MAVRKIFGRAKVTANGIVLANSVGAVASGIGKSGKPAMRKKPVNTSAGVFGYVEEPINPQLELTIIDSNEQTLNDLAVIGDGDTIATVVFESFSGGKQYILNDATAQGDFGLTEGDGNVTVIFFGSSWTENVLG